MKSKRYVNKIFKVLSETIKNPTTDDGMILNFLKIFSGLYPPKILPSLITVPQTKSIFGLLMIYFDKILIALEYNIFEESTMPTNSPFANLKPLFHASHIPLSFSLIQ